jgi:hypothetical protein
MLSISNGVMKHCEAFQLGISVAFDLSGRLIPNYRKIYGGGYLVGGWLVLALTAGFVTALSLFVDQEKIGK